MAKVALRVALSVAEGRSQLRLGPVGGLELRILVNAQCRRMVRRVVAQRADIAVNMASVDSLMVLARCGFTPEGRSQRDTP